MPRPDFPVTIMGFQARFADEDACRQYLFASRWPDGFLCRRCGGGEIGAMHRRRQVWQCKACGAQTSVTAGTVMHGTRMPLQLWFWAAYLVATHHPGISAVQLQRQLGIGCHETAWMMLHKLRRAMVAPEREPLKREVEVDEFFQGGLEEGLRGGRQRAKKALVGVAIEVRGRGSGRVRLQVLRDASGDALGAFVKATTTTRRHRAQRRLDGLQRPGRARLRPPPAQPERGADRRAAPAAGPPCRLEPQGLATTRTHRKSSLEHLPAYLDEFTFRHNRRANPHAAFQTLLGLSARHEPATYRQIIDRAA